MAHGKGQAHIGNLGIYRSLAGDAHGKSRDTHGGIHIRPAQLLDRQGRTGKDGVGILIGQHPEAVPRLIRKGLEIRKFHIAVFIPIDLICQRIGMIPIINRCFFQLVSIVGSNLHTNVIRQRAGIVVQAKDCGMNHIHEGAGSQHPAEPLDGIPFQNDHQNQTCQSQHQKHDRT